MDQNNENQSIIFLLLEDVPETTQINHVLVLDCIEDGSPRMIWNQLAFQREPVVLCVCCDLLVWFS